MNHVSPFIYPETSWELMIEEAHRRVTQGKEYTSNKQSKHYKITAVNGEGTSATIHIELGEVHNSYNMGFRSVANFLARFNGQFEKAVIFGSFFVFLHY